MNYLALFASAFIVVFFLGLQSLNVNGGRYRAAFVTSFGIGISNLILYKLAPSADGAEVIAYLLGGPFGIVASMYFNRRMRTILDILRFFMGSKTK